MPFLIDPSYTGCGPDWFAPAYCDAGHKFAKVLYCNKEYCNICGAPWSPSHQRRFARWMEKYQKMDTVGYFVFTIPPEIRNGCRSKARLNSIRKDLIDFLKSVGFERGFSRWHYFGDKSPGEYAPHLNVLIDADYIPPSILEAIKNEWKNILAVEKVDIFYEYSNAINKKIHWMKYITKATFTELKWDIELAVELIGFRNNHSWGHNKWDGAPAWIFDTTGHETDDETLDINAINRISERICPRCNNSLNWSKRVEPYCQLGFYPHNIILNLGAGFFELQRARAPDHALPRSIN